MLVVGIATSDAHAIDEAASCVDLGPAVHAGLLEIDADLLRFGARLERKADRNTVSRLEAIDRKADIVVAVYPGKAGRDVRALAGAVRQNAPQIRQPLDVRIRACRRLSTERGRQHEAADLQVIGLAVIAVDV